MRSYPTDPMFVTFEGLDGSGKTTQVELLRERLEAEGHEVVAVREPGGTELGEGIRTLLLHGSHMTAWAEAALYAAARAELVDEVIAPALERGADVLCDRYVDSSLAYQGVARGLGVERVLELNLPGDPRAAARPHVRARARGRTSRPGASARAPTGSSARASRSGSGSSDGYRELAARFPDRIVTLDGSLPPSELADRIDSELHAELRRAFLSSTRRSASSRRRSPRGRRTPTSSTGRRGRASAQAAFAFAAALLGDPRRVNERTHPDLYVLEPLGEMIRIDEIRELRRDLHMRPFEADRRVYLILDAHLLNEDAADALLKDLEEPPPYAVIVLVADELGPLPPTIRSRCQLVPFRRLSGEGGPGVDRRARRPGSRRPR